MLTYFFFFPAARIIEKKKINRLKTNPFDSLSKKTFSLRGKKCRNLEMFVLLFSKKTYYLKFAVNRRWTKLIDQPMCKPVWIRKQT